MMEAAPERTFDWQEALRSLYQARQELTEAKKAVELAEEQFREEKAALYTAVDSAITSVSIADNHIRVAALTAYQEDPSSKEIAPGVSIRVMTEYEYAGDAAFAWAKEHQMCLVLDNKAFRAVCTSTCTRPEFVEVYEHPTATIATDLSQYIEPYTKGDNDEHPR